MTPWILTEIATGLQKLHLLSLDRTPSADTIAGTAQAWCEVVEDGRSFDLELDADRFRRAFVKLAGVTDRWPSPKQFLEVLDATRRPQLALTKQHLPADKARAAAAFAELADVLGVSR